MKLVSKLLGRTYYVCAMMVLFAMPAFAYLDPGTVSYVVSMIAGLFIACGAVLAIFRRKIKLFFQNLGKKDKKMDSTSAPSMSADVVNPMDDLVNPMDDGNRDEDRP